MRHYRSCGECGHTWATRAEFLADVQTVLDGLYARYPGDRREMRESDEWICPQCTHDF